MNRAPNRRVHLDSGGGPTSDRSRKRDREWVDGDDTDPATLRATGAADQRFPLSPSSPLLGGEATTACSSYSTAAASSPPPDATRPCRRPSILFSRSDGTAVPTMDGVVQLNVGGRLFVVHRETLLGKHCKNVQDRTSSQQTFFANLLLPDAAAPLVVDENGAVLIDRDGAAFAVILNYLRGYESALLVSPALKSLVAQDAAYYGLQGLARQLQAKPHLPLHFALGPGVSPDGTRLRATYGINFVGDHFLMSGVHRVTFEILRSEYLGIGVASDHCVGMDVEFHKINNCAIYYFTGVYYSCIRGCPRKEEGLPKYNVGDFVTLTLDMDAAFLEFRIRDTTKVVSLKGASKLRFAVTLRSQSGVRIHDTRSDV